MSDIFDRFLPCVWKKLPVTMVVDMEEKILFGIPLYIQKFYRKGI